MKPYYQDEWVTIYHGDCREILPELFDRSAGLSRKAIKIRGVSHYIRHNTMQGYKTICGKVASFGHNVEMVDRSNINCVVCKGALPELPKVDLVLTDPPYFLPAKHYETRRSFARSLGDLSILEFFYDATFRDCLKLLRDTGFLYVFCDGQSYPVFYVKLYSQVKSLRPLIWDKITSINGYSWRHQHEIILFAEMPNAPTVKTGDGDILRYRAEPIDDRLHPSQKPIDLMKALIAKSLPEGGIVLDPFIGSGTTAISSKALNRKCIGIEIEEKYCEIAASRCRQMVFDLT